MPPILEIARRHDVGELRHLLDLLNMAVSDLAAADDGNLQRHPRKPSSLTT